MLCFSPIFCTIQSDAQLESHECLLKLVLKANGKNGTVLRKVYAINETPFFRLFFSPHNEKERHAFNDAHFMLSKTRWQQQKSTKECKKI